MLFPQSAARALHRLAVARLRCSALIGEALGPDAGMAATQPVEAMGLRFPAVAGMAAGVDRYGAFAHLAHRLGLGLVETGTVTLRPEAGHNRGMDALLANLSRHDRNRRRSRVGISIAANVATPVEETWRDLCGGMERAWDHADYFTLNLGGRIPPLARQPSALRTLLQRVKNRQHALAHERHRYAPVIVKVRVWREFMTEAVILVEAARAAGLDGVLAAVAGAGADDGAALTKSIAGLANGRLAIISVGGIRSAENARVRIAAGAALVQMHRGLLWRGPALARAVAAQPAAFPATRARPRFP